MKASPIQFCPVCGTEVARNQRFCSVCGVRLHVPDQPTTVTQPPGRHSTLSDYVTEARFAPGAVLARRYRIVNLLGRCGMGEVYRADDLLLRQPVALKFLRAIASSSELALSRFRDEVRIARQVSHPNVCRVYDIGEADGLTFITMEYVDGEDLACMLRRIGKLPREKAMDVASLEGRIHGVVCNDVTTRKSYQNE